MNRVYPIEHNGPELGRAVSKPESAWPGITIAAMLADRHDLAVRDEVVRLQGGWTARQLAEDRLRNQLNSAQASQNFPAEKRLADGEVFRKYAYQWY